MIKKIILSVGLFLTGSFFLIGETGLNGDPQQGKTVFEKHCSSCHGKKGEGLGPVTRMPNFSFKSYQDSRTNQQLFDKISAGGQGSGMPAWEKTLTLQERWNVVAYIRTLATH
ncbi:MAG: c-type cytochrome [Nitrospiria bacterium]